jgi:3-methylfumaryl-CoA hydratase
MTDQDGAAAPEVVVRTELVTPQPAEALAGLLDIAPPEDCVPPAWHWVYLLDRRPSADLGHDGHPTSGVPAPPGPGRLRMFAGGRITEHACLRFGAPATRTTQVVASTEKQGRSGPLTFVTVRHSIEQGGRVAVVDEQDIVYRAPGTTLRTDAAPDAAPARHEAPPAAADCLQLQVDNVLLFRFSALTYNGHRIHYDLGYAAEEGYPGLVVHGPLQALLLRELFRRAGAPCTGSRFSYRLVSPVFGQPLLTVRPLPDETVRTAGVEDPAGRVTATGSLRPL